MLCFYSTVSVRFMYGILSVSFNLLVTSGF